MLLSARSSLTFSLLACNSTAVISYVRKPVFSGLKEGVMALPSKYV
jgi:hypothetical protein